MLRYVKGMLKRDSLRSPEHKGFINYVKRKLNPEKYIPNRFASIFVNRYCNLDCFSCGALGMHPEPDETTIEEINLFLDRMKGVQLGSTVMLTGGEPTMVKLTKLEAICKKIHDSGYKTAILSNGFRLMDSYELFDYIALDDHGVNSAQIEALQKKLKSTGRLVSVVSKTYHQDIKFAMENNITKGVRCSNWMRPLTLWKNIVYPCCNIACVEWWHNTNVVTDALFKAAWHVDNPSLRETVENWRVSLPAEVYRLCSLGCWRDSSKARWRRIGVS